MAPLVLRDYQRQACDAYYRYLDAGGQAGLITMATGLGKSLLIATICKELIARYPDIRILSIVHSKELVGQNFSELMHLWPFAPAGINSAGLHRRDWRSQILFAGIQSIHRHVAALGYADLVIIDEAHLTPKGSLGTYHKTLNELRTVTPGMRVLGLTATDFRLDSGNLVEGDNRLFDRVVYKYGIKEGIRDGWLAPLMSKAMAAQIDTRGVKIVGGDFAKAELQTAAMRGDNVKRAVAEIVQWGKDRRAWLVFCSGVKHAEAVCAELRYQHNVLAACVTNETDSKDRDAFIRQFKRGELQCLVNVNVLTTGFNAPQVDLIALLRPTKSAGLAVQQIGRGTRLADGKQNCLVLDFASIFATHGPVDEMKGRDKRKRKGSDEPRIPVKICPECNGISPISAWACEQCGFVWVKEPKEPGHSGSADGSNVVVSIEAKPEWWKPRTWRFSIHQKEGKPPCLRIRYIFGLATVVNEFLHFEMQGWAQSKAAARWADLSDSKAGSLFAPQTTDDAYRRALAGELRMPPEVCVRKDGKYINVVSVSGWKNAA